MITESFSKEQLTRNVSTTLLVTKYQRNNFHYFQTTGTTGTLLEILSEHTLAVTDTEEQEGTVRFYLYIFITCKEIFMVNIVTG